MAEIADIASQLVRVDIVRDQQRAAEGRQGDRAREEAAGEVRDGNASVIREREDARHTAEVRARREEDARDAELAIGIRRNIDLSADAAFDPELPRGSIIDIIA